MCMSREATDSGTGEFFINLKDNKHLDRSGDSGWKLGFAVWGEVVSGMEIAEKITEAPTEVKGGLKMLIDLVPFKATLTSA